MGAKEIKFEVKEDFGSFGDGNWMKHLTLTQWNDDEPKYDIRAWNDDMTKCGRGITLTKEELIDLSDLIEKILSK